MISMLLERNRLYWDSAKIQVGFHCLSLLHDRITSTQHWVLILCLTMEFCVGHGIAKPFVAETFLNLILNFLWSNPREIFSHDCFHQFISRTQLSKRQTGSIEQEETPAKITMLHETWRKCVIWRDWPLWDVLWGWNVPGCLLVSDLHLEWMMSHMLGTLYSFFNS